MPKQSNVVITISPTPGTVGQEVTITASNLPDDYLNIMVTDSVGTAAIPVGYAVNGTVSCQHLNNFTGTSTVEIHADRHNRWVTLPGTATFEVVA